MSGAEAARSLVLPVTVLAVEVEVGGTHWLSMGISMTDIED